MSKKRTICLVVVMSIIILVSGCLEESVKRGEEIAVRESQNVKRIVKSNRNFFENEFKNDKGD